MLASAETTPHPSRTSSAPPSPTKGRRKKVYLKPQRAVGKLRRQAARNRRADRFGREKQIVAMPGEPELVVRDIVGIGVGQIAVAQQEHTGIAEIAEELENLRCLRVADGAFEKHDRSYPAQHLLAAVENAALMPFDVALDEPDIGEQVVRKRIEARHRHAKPVL